MDAAGEMRRRKEKGGLSRPFCLPVAILKDCGDLLNITPM
jgi:hypothetical protein